MNKIGFQNFRRFINFPELEYGGITLLVGKNNSGKSTLVKALMLVNEYIKSSDLGVFSFANELLENANIVTFDRAKNKYSDSPIISFSFQIESFNVEVAISGKEGKTNADVVYYQIEDLTNGYILKIEPPAQHITFTSKHEQDNDRIIDINRSLDEIKEQISNLKLQQEVQKSKGETSHEYIEIISTIEKLEKKKEELSKSRKAEQKKNANYSFDMESELKGSLVFVFKEFMKRCKRKYDNQFREIQKGKKETKEFVDLKGFNDDHFKIENSFDNYIQITNKTNILYLGANPAKQSALFSIRDKNNALAQAFHEFEQLDIQNQQSDASRFVKKWMKEFEIGEDFSVILHAGEAYEVNILINGKQIPLADKGMGSIQAMLLIIRLACVLFKAQKNQLTYTVIIEEPELNLHPALQSKLAEIFYEITDKYKIQLIVETHSEYIIRRTQVIVAEKELTKGVNDNLFNLYYFPIEGTPYHIEYDQDGVLKRNFDNGFFDEASASTLELLKIKRQNKA